MKRRCNAVENSARIFSITQGEAFNPQCSYEERGSISAWVQCCCIACNWFISWIFMVGIGSQGVREPTSKETINLCEICVMPRSRCVMKYQTNHLLLYQKYKFPFCTIFPLTGNYSLAEISTTADISAI